MNNYELCINLWYSVDKKSGFINAIAGRGYYLQGSDEQKTAILKQLAGADFVCVEWQPVPDRYETRLVDVENHSQAAFSGFVHASDLDVHGLALFEDVFAHIERVHQNYIPIKNAVTLKVPDEPLYVMTAVEHGDNNKIRVVLA